MEKISTVAIATVIRSRRERECFPIVNRGKLWYNLLTPEQYGELNKWYKDWLDAPETKIIPLKPKWLDEKLNLNEEIL